MIYDISLMWYRGMRVLTRAEGLSKVWCCLEKRFLCEGFDEATDPKSHDPQCSRSMRNWRCVPPPRLQFQSSTPGDNDNKNTAGRHICNLGLFSPVPQFVFLSSISRVSGLVAQEF